MSNESVPVELVGVRIELPTNQPIVLLKETHGRRYLPIWIGAPEATAIAFALEHVETARPLTHDLLKLSVEALGAAVERVVVTELRDGIYYADLVLTAGEREVIVSARPSDAIALAARTGSPLYVYPGVLDEAGVELKDEAEAESAYEDFDPEEEVRKMRDFLEEVTPEDFGAPPEGPEGS